MLLLNFAMILLIGFILSYLTQKIGLPHILGLLLTGWILGPYATNLLQADLLILSPLLRKVALFIILLRVGLNLSIKEIKNLGISALLLTLLPALFEISAYTFIAHYLLALPFLEAAMMGSVIAAVSPAIIVPRMIKLLQKPYNKRVPQLLMSAASLDDILVIVIFSTLLIINTGEDLSLTATLLTLPISLILGAIGGYITALLVNFLHKRFDFLSHQLIIILFGLTLLLGTLEQFMAIPFSGLIAIIIFSLSLEINIKNQTKESFAMFWHSAEIWLFVLVGAQLNLSLLNNNLLVMITTILLALLIRSLGVLTALSTAPLHPKEKLYCLFSFLPKATVQASIGALAMEAGVASGELILTMAILSIIITAPLGALLMDKFQDKLLSKNFYS